jgi:hypothetical protein
MTVMELCERCGIRDGQRGLAYIKDGLLEIGQRIPEQTKRYTFSVVDGTRFYNMPSDHVRTLGLYRKFDNDGKYVPIARAQNVQILQDSSSSTATSDSDLIVI